MQEEIARRSVRAERFQTAGQGLDYRPKERKGVEDLDKKRKRAARFGTVYIAPDDTGLMDVGVAGPIAAPPVF